MKKTRRQCLPFGHAAHVSQVPVATHDDRHMRTAGENS
jgi:hypothetical protein